MTISELVDWANSELGLKEQQGGEGRGGPVTRRTIHYYISLGLLPPSEGKGQNAVYGYEHQLRLRLIKMLQDEFLPLKEIRHRLGNLTAGEMESLIELASAEPSAPLSAPEDVLYAALAPPRPEPDMWALPKQNALPLRQATNAPMFSVRRACSEPLWKRVELADSVELHYSVQPDAAREKAIQRVIAEARQRLRAFNEEHTKRRDERR